MKSKQLVIRCAHGLHVRVAGQIVKLVQQHDADVELRSPDGHSADAASIMQVLMLGAAEGSHIEVLTKGPDEILVMNALTEVFENGAGI